MRRFTNILLIDDGRNNLAPALNRAVMLAERHGAMLTVARVMSELPRDLRRLAAALPPEMVQDLAMEEHHEELQRLLAPLRLEGYRIASKLLIGPAHRAVLEEVTSVGHDLVILPARKLGLWEKIFGDLATTLIRECPVPVWVHKPAANGRAGKIIAAVDLSTEAPESRELDERILEVAECLSVTEGGELHIVHAWNLDSEMALQYRAGISAAEMEHLMSERRRQAREHLQGLLKRLGGAVRARIHLRKGEARDVIARIAKKQRATAVVMGSKGRRGLLRMLAGNGAEAIARKSPCAVIAVKPCAAAPERRLQAA